MVRSARCSFSLGRTAKRPQPARAITRRRLKEDRQTTGVLLGVLRLVFVEEHPLAGVEAQGDALLQRDLEAAADADRHLGARREGEGVLLGRPVGEADA